MIARQRERLLSTNIVLQCVKTDDVLNVRAYCRVFADGSTKHQDTVAENVDLRIEIRSIGRCQECETGVFVDDRITNSIFDRRC